MERHELTDTGRRVIRVRGAAQNNLQDVDVDIPLDAIVAVTGVSGSGKSSLAFDTLFREGQRRFLESFSTYARHFLRALGRPAVDEIAGLAPAVAVGQRSVTPTTRSTVGTLSEVSDYLRLLFARLGERPCGACGAMIPARSRACPGCGAATEPLTRAQFSFNTPAGACPTCDGLGEQDRVDPELLVAYPERTIRDGALAPTLPRGYIMYSQVTMDVLNDVCQAHGFSVDIPWQDLDEEAQRVVLYGSERIEVPYGKHSLESRMKWSGITARPRQMGYYKGIVPVIAAILARGRNPSIMRYVSSCPCPECDGDRLRKASRDVRLRGIGIAQLSRSNVQSLRAFLAGARWSPEESPVAEPIAAALDARLTLMGELGLSHLEFHRPGRALSDGELRRLRLAALAGGSLNGLLVVLDEPSVGLHPRDQERLAGVLEALRDRGNGVLLVEHERALVERADWRIEMGPGAGREGGRLLYAGPNHVESSQTPPAPASRSESVGEVVIQDARLHNLRGDPVTLKRRALNVVTGVSGAGKTTLVEHVLARTAERLVGGEDRPIDRRGCGSISGLAEFDRVVCVDTAPIGRTPRSNPATYTKLFDAVRTLFARTPAAEAAGLGAGHFSFNRKGGRCEVCEGAGVRSVGMQFMAAAEVPCDACGGRRFDAQTLEVRWQGRNIYDVLQMSVAEAATFFADEKKIATPLQALVDVGLGYLGLGQPATTLSGGEARRVKLAAELARAADKKGRGRNGRGHGGATLYVMDEPTGGLHPQDVRTLLAVLARLVAAGHTVVVAEHDLDVLAAAHWIVDLGPQGGEDGGRVVAQGPPDAVAAGDSPTGRALAAHLRGELPPASESGAAPSAPPDGTREIRLEGVRTHNLRGVDARFPRGEMTVVTGPSGSGKSSLAFDTLYAEGQRRFTESMSPFARRFIARMRRPDVGRVTGLGPTVAVRQHMAPPNPRSTVGTASEVLDHVRLLFSRAGRNAGSNDAGGEHGLPARAFSFNDEAGACPDCAGLGARTVCSAEKLVSHPERSLLAGAMDGHKYGRFLGEADGQYVATLRTVGAALDVDFERPWCELDDRARALALEGTGDRRWEVRWEFRRAKRSGVHEFEGEWPGLLALVQTEWARTHADRRGAALADLMVDVPCPTCGGARLRTEALTVQVGGRDISAWAGDTVDELTAAVAALETSDDPAGGPAMAEVRAAILGGLTALSEVGLGYVALERPVRSLSGGERRRLQLASQLGARLTNVTYVLDEPTVGLHPRDTERLLGVLDRLRREGNTVVVVEHDLDVVRAASRVLELGPGAGADGGRLVADTTPQALAEADTATGRALRRTVGPRQQPRTMGASIGLRDVDVHNLRGVDVDLPTGGLIAVAGPSGAGKTSLVFDALAESAAAGRPRSCAAVSGLEMFAAVVPIDGRPIGRTPASTPATYTGLDERIRKLFAASDGARAAGLKAGDFSLNRKGGRCESCKGLGQHRVAMDFLADVWVPCEACGGRRFGERVLGVTLGGRTIVDVLGSTVDEAAEFFVADRKLVAGLALLGDVGLGHLQLGQAGNTLSGGEARRLRLAAELLKRPGRGRRGGGEQRRLYLVDEPSVGLHPQDVDGLLALLQRLVEAGDTVIVVDHDLGLLSAADWIVELGPEGGPRGGTVVASGTPSQLAARDDSPTGDALRKSWKTNR